MDKFLIAKKTASFLVGCGTGTIVGQIVRNNVTPTNTFEKVTVVLATVASASMVGEKAGAFTEQKMDEVRSAIKSSN